MKTAIWHAWAGGIRVASAEFPATHSAEQVRNEFCDQGYNARSNLRVTCARPIVGMLATVGIGSDRYPFTVSSVSPSGSKITLTARKARGPLTIENSEGEIRIAYRQAASGNYETQGHGVIFGEAEMRLDPSF